MFLARLHFWLSRWADLLGDWWGASDDIRGEEWPQEEEEKAKTDKLHFVRFRSRNKDCSNLKANSFGLVKLSSASSLGWREEEEKNEDRASCCLWRKHTSSVPLRLSSLQANTERGCKELEDTYLCHCKHRSNILLRWEMLKLAPFLSASARLHEDHNKERRLPAKRAQIFGCWLRLHPRNEPHQKAPKFMTEIRSLATLTLWEEDVSSFPRSRNKPLLAKSEGILFSDTNSVVALH